MSSNARDVRQALRGLSRSPGFTGAAIGILALGIGACTATFSVVYGVLWKPFPYRYAGRIVVLSESCQRSSERSVSIPNFHDWRAQNRTFDSIGVAAGWNFVLNGVETPERLAGALASHDFFAALGVHPIAGRTFVASEDAPGGPRSVVLSEALWRRLFAGRSDAVGKSVLLSGERWTIVGVAPASLRLPSEQTQIWGCLAPMAAELENRGAHAGFDGYARLKKDVTLSQARADLDAIAGRLAASFPETNRGAGVTVLPLADSVAGNAKPALTLLLGAVGLMLLIACANIAGLMLARAAARRREMAIRRALGASPSRLLGQLLTESLLLAAAGGSAGTLLAVWAVPLLPKILPGDLPRADAIAVNPPVLAFALAAAVLCGLLFGVAPALMDRSRRNLAAALSENGRIGPGLPATRARGWLLVAEIALATLLAAASGLLVKSFVLLQSASPGIDPRGVLAAEVRVPDRYDDARTVAFAEEVLARAAAAPGVDSAATVIPLPLSGQGFQDTVRVEGQTGEDSGGHRVDIAMIAGDYFSTMRVPILRGRGLEAADRAGALPVVVVDENFARRILAGRDPVGARLRLVRPADRGSQPWRTVVGVAGHVKNYGAAAVSRPEVYFPLGQRPVGRLNLVLRGRSDPALLAGAAREAVRAADPDVPLYNVRTLDSVVARTVATPRFTAGLIALFAAAALLLASVGTYSVAAYGVRLRSRELAVRTALGARPADLVLLVLNASLKRCALGLTFGAAGLFAFSRFLSKLLFGVHATDPGVFLAAAACVLLAAGAAGWLPARRAARVDPAQALRHQ